MSLEILNLSLVSSYWKLITFSFTVGLHILVNILYHFDIIVLFYLVHRHAVSNIVFPYHCFCRGPYGRLVFYTNISSSENKDIIVIIIIIIKYSFLHEQNITTCCSCIISFDM